MIQDLKIHRFQFKIKLKKKIQQKDPIVKISNKK